MNFLVPDPNLRVSQKLFFRILNIYNNLKLNRFAPKKYCILDKQHTEP